MGWRFTIRRDGEAIFAVARDPLGRRHEARLTPPRLTLIGAGPHHPCRMAEALGLSECLIGPPAPSDPAEAEISAHRHVTVGALLAWRSRLQAAAELDRLSGVVADEIMAKGVAIGGIGLVPILHLRADGDALAIPVRLGTEAEMRAELSKERSGTAANVVIEAMAITAFGPAPEAPPPEPGSVDAIVIDPGWRIDPGPNEELWLRRD